MIHGIYSTFYPFVIIIVVASSDFFWKLLISHG